VLVTTVITSPYRHQGVGLATDVVRAPEAIPCPARRRRAPPAVAVLAGSLIHPPLIRNRATRQSPAVRWARDEPGESPCVSDPTPRWAVSEPGGGRAHASRDRHASAWPISRRCCRRGCPLRPGEQTRSDL